MHRRTLFASAAALLLAAGLYTNLSITPALALDELRIIAPAAPGGGRPVRPGPVCRRVPPH